MQRSNSCRHTGSPRLSVLCTAALSLTASAATRAAGLFEAHPTLIEAPNGTSTEATDLNNAGVLVGVYNAPEARAFAWSRSTGFVDLEGATTSSFSLANAINECSQVVGELNSHAVRWNTFHEVEDLGTLGGSNSAAADINDRGDVVGTSQMTPGGRHTPFLWTDEGGMRQIVECEGESGTARALNNARQVVGSCDDLSNRTRAFFWSEHTGRIDLNLPGFQNSAAIGINDRGEVVGDAYNASPEFVVVAFKWTPTTGKLVFLRDLGHHFSTPRDINQAGLIMGDAVDSNNVRHAVGWLTPTWGGEVDPSLGTTESSAGALNDLGSAVGTLRFAGPYNLRAVLWEPSPIVSQALAKLGPRRCLR